MDAFIDLGIIYWVWYYGKLCNVYNYKTRKAIVVLYIYWLYHLMQHNNGKGQVYITRPSTTMIM